MEDQRNIEIRPKVTRDLDGQQKILEAAETNPNKVKARISDVQ